MQARLLFLVAEVTRSLSNVIKSGFVAFAHDDKLVIDSELLYAEKENKVIRSIDEQDEDIEDLELEDILEDNTYKETEFEEKRVLADMMLQDAKTQSERMLSEARLQAAQIMESAKQDGYQAGYAEGIEKAEQEKQDALKELQKQVELDKLQVLSAIEAEKNQFLNDAEPKMAALACDLVTKLTGIVVEEQKDVLFYIINRTMRDIEDSKHFIVKVSEEDYELLESRKDEIYGANNPGIFLEIFADVKLSRNQCVIETDNGMVDCSLDVQLKNLIRDIRLLSSTQ